MNEQLNPLIKETLAEVVSDANIKKFILDILNIERSYSPRDKKRRYEAALEKYVGQS